MTIMQIEIDRDIIAAGVPVEQEVSAQLAATLPLLGNLLDHIPEGKGLIVQFIAGDMTPLPKG